jgi:ketosteroid isomerase-like protein
MKGFFSASFSIRTIRTAASLLLGAALLLACTASSAAPQKKKKNQPAADDGKPVLPMGDEQQIDYLISEMLGAWQIGDVDRLHKDYADDLWMVNGVWAPPVFTWTNFLALYQQQRARMQQVRMDRSNTYIKVAGNFAWACYQWDFSAVVDGQPSAARGQTTLILEKRTDRWVIVHNHTSLAPTTQPIPPSNTPQIAQPQPKNPSAR